MLGWTWCEVNNKRQNVQRSSSPEEGVRALWFNNDGINKDWLVTMGVEDDRVVTIAEILANKEQSPSFLSVVFLCLDFSDLKSERVKADRSLVDGNANTLH